MLQMSASRHKRSVPQNLQEIGSYLIDTDTKANLQVRKSEVSKSSVPGYVVDMADHLLPLIQRDIFQTLF